MFEQLICDICVMIPRHMFHPLIQLEACAQQFGPCLLQRRFPIGFAEGIVWAQILTPWAAWRFHRSSKGR